MSSEVGMSAFGWIFMTVSWLLILSTSGFCIYKILKVRTKEK